MTTTTPAAKPVRVTDATFAFDVLRSPLPVLVDFYADWCGACRALAPTFDALAAEYDGRVRFAKVDVEKHEAIAARLGIRGIPALVLFEGGEERWRLVNVVRRDPIVAELDRTLASGPDAA